MSLRYNNFPLLELKCKRNQSIQKVITPISRLFKTNTTTNNDNNIKKENKHNDEMKTKLGEYNKNIRKTLKLKIDEENQFPFSQDDKTKMKSNNLYDKMNKNNYYVFNLTFKEKVHTKDKGVLSRIVSSSRFLFRKNNKTHFLETDNKDIKTLAEHRNEHLLIESRSEKKVAPKTIVMKTIENDKYRNKFKEIGNVNITNTLTKQQTLSHPINRSVLFSPKKVISSTSKNSIIVNENNSPKTQRHTNSQYNFKIIREQFNFSPIKKKKSHHHHQVTISSIDKKKKKDNYFNLINTIEVNGPEEQHFANVAFFERNKIIQLQF